MKKLFTLLFSLFVFFIQTPIQAQVQKWYYEDFSSGTGGWAEPEMSPNPPEAIGEGQSYLQNESAGGEGAGSNWVMTNTSDSWIGDFEAAGVENITLHIRHSGSESMHFRFAFSNDNGATYVNTKPMIVKPGDHWQAIHFSLEEEDLSASAGGDIGSIMSSVASVRFLHSADPAWKGEPIASTVQIASILMTGEVDYKAYLTGDNQLPAVATDGYGILYGEEENDTLTVWGELSGISSGIDSTIAGGMHIHNGIAGMNGSVVFPLVADFSEDGTAAILEPGSNQFVLTEEQQEMLEDHGFYVNVHSMDFSGGEIRGQILPAEDHLYRSNLHGSNKLPAIMTAAEGRVVMSLDSNELTVSGSFGNLSSALATEIAGGGHIHMALPGSNGGVEIPLHIQVDSAGNSGILWADSNEYELSADQINALRNRMLYINIHSENHQSGEIRGQIVSAASRKLFRAYLSGTNEVPMVSTTALGMVNIELLTADSILVFGSYHGLSSPLNTGIAGGIHLHGGMAGENAGVLFPLINTQDSTISGRLETTGYALDSATYALLTNRSTYVNIHTEAHGGGEIRGQVLSDVPWHFSAPMTSSQQISSAVSDGFGALKGEWNGHQLILSGVIQNLSSPIATAIAGGGHIHMAMAGQNGGVIFPLHLQISEDGRHARLHPDSNVYILPDSIAVPLANRGLYANIHTENFNGGEVRGQLLFDAAMYAAAVMGGSLQNPPVNTPGKGLALLELNPESATFTGSVSSLTAPIDTSIAGGGHIHVAIAGQNGPVASPIALTLAEDGRSATIQAWNNIYPVTPDLIDLYLMRNLYLNVHTTAHSSGEVRGQILPLSAYYLIANAHGSNEVPPIDSTGWGTVLAEVNGNQAVLSGSFSGLSSAVAVDIAGGAHIHQAPAGTNGSVLVPLFSQLSADSLSGVFIPDSNLFDAGENSLMDLWQAGLYVNIHSQNYTSGELRGQLLPMINYFPNVDSMVFTSSDIVTIDTTNMDTQVSFEWTAAEDLDPLIYQLEWAVDSTFDSIILRSPYGMSPGVSISDSLLLDTLMDWGYFMESDTACLMVRMHVSDGSLSAHSTVQQVCFILGVRTSLEDPLQSVVRISPVPASQEITINIRNYEGFRNQPNVNLSIYNLFGQMVKQKYFRIHGTDHREVIDILSLPSGHYFLRMNQGIWPFIKL